MARITLFGDSYIRRLRDFCNGDLKIPGTVRFFGKGGMKALGFDHALWEGMMECNPDVCILCIGGNDIAATSCPADIYQGIMRLVTELKEKGCRVIVTELSERGSFSKSPGLQKWQFESQRKIINRRLKNILGVDFITFKKIKFPQDYDKDLVHFGTGKAKGQKKFFYAVRGVLCALKM